METIGESAGLALDIALRRGAAALAVFSTTEVAATLVLDFFLTGTLAALSRAVATAASFFFLVGMGELSLLKGLRNRLTTG